MVNGKKPHKNRICIYTDKWGSGGIESFILNMLEHMEREDLEIDIVAAKLESELYMQRVEALGIGFYLLSGSIRKLRKNRAMLKNLFEEREYTAIHLNIYQALPLIYLKDAQKAGIPIRIAHSHNTGLRRSTGQYAKLFIHYAVRRFFTHYATKCLSCSRRAAEFMFKKGTDYAIIANGIETGRFAFSTAGREAERSGLGLDGRFVIGNIGRLCSQKNQSFLLDVLAELKKRCPQSTLLLVGEGEDLEMLKKRAKKRELLDSVIFYGVTDNIPPLYWAMDVFLLPSLFEGLGIVAIEAQAAGLPVICSENVPPEAGPTTLAEFIPLKEGPEKWAESALACKERQRQNVIPALLEAGYDIKKGAKELRNLYGREQVKI